MSQKFNTAERAALKKFRVCISDLIKTFDEYDAHDKNLIRWLRARDLNVRKAEFMIRESLKQKEIDNVAELKHLPLSEFLLEKLPFSPCGHDKEGTIICVIPCGKWDLKSLLQQGYKDEMLRYLCQFFEKYFHYMKLNNSVEDFKTGAIILLDLEDFSVYDIMSNQVFSFLIELLKGYEEHYPEVMKATYIVNVPKVFEILFSMVKPFIPTGTLSKVQIHGGSSDHWRKALLEKIDYRDLPSQYGGSNSAHPFYSNRFGLTWPGRAKIFPPEDFITEAVPPREKITKSFELLAGDRISWNFKTDCYDIGFEFLFNGVRMFPYARADAHVCVQDGLYDVMENGTYVLVFDNTYSKYRSKILHYIIVVENSG
ncbi:unnamed protein product [Allacma fusca]|uniref:SEC14-like protein 2 n=1 Tax=Allacma fusca TaxID=39272 RepID=A0A8J2LI29_9HEXA|nr:unnamed protein product [Allacma fusca]